MRYHTGNSTFFIRGSFRAASTGVCGGLRTVPAILHHTILPGEEPDDPDKILGRAAARAGLGMEYTGFVSPIPANRFCILQYDFITVFVAAGIREGPGAGTGGIPIIVTSAEGFTDAALVEAIMVAAEAKADALHALGLPGSGTEADGIIVACEGDTGHRAAGRTGPAGMRIREAIVHGIPEALKRHDAGIPENRPAYFIFSRFRGEHWIEWVPETCPYYPCHFRGQSCDFCYCPFYPCKNEDLGQWVESANGGRVWNCADCTLLHDPKTAEYFRKFPGSTLEELMLFAASKKR
jgi:adenosylcobinamide hydrolase